jgi:ZIP family zinc transporter
MPINSLLEWLREMSENSENGHHILAFSLAFIASMGTFLGGLLVILVTTIYSDPKSLDTKLLMGILQAFSAGVMLYITCFDLVPESIQILNNRETMYY